MYLSLWWEYITLRQVCDFVHSSLNISSGSIFAVIASLQVSAKSEFKYRSQPWRHEFCQVSWLLHLPLFLLLWVIGCHGKHTFSKDWAKSANPPWQKGDLEDSSGATTLSLSCSTSPYCSSAMKCDVVSYIGASPFDWMNSELSQAVLWSYNLMEMKIIECHNGDNNNVDVIQVCTAS